MGFQGLSWVFTGCLNHTCPHRRFWVGLIFEVSDSVFYRSRTNIDIGKTAQHMRNFSKKSNVTPLISDDCSDRPDEKWCGVEPGWTNDIRKLWFRLKYSKWFKMFHINLWKFPIFSLFQWNFSISTSTLQNSIFDNIIFQLVLSIIEDSHSI